MYMVQWRCKEKDPRTRAAEVRSDPHAHASPSLGFINYSLSSLVSSAAFQPQLPSPLHLPSWWYSAVLVRVAGKQCSRESVTLSSISPWPTYSPSGFNHHAFPFDHSAADVAESSPGVKQTPVSQRARTRRGVFIITVMPSVWQTKIIMRCQRAGGLNKNAVQIFDTLAISEVQITVLWWQLWEQTVGWIIQGQSVWQDSTDTCRNLALHAPPRLLNTLSLTSAIKDYLCKQITDQNPWPLASLREPCSEIPAHHVEQITIPFSGRLMQSTICCNAEVRGVLQDLTSPFKHPLPPGICQYSTKQGQQLNTDPLSMAVCILRRIQRSMKHVRLMIFCNWISQKAGDKVPHTPLILPISTAGLKRALLCRWIWRKGGERGREENAGIVRWVWIAPRLHPNERPQRAVPRVPKHTA